MPWVASEVGDNREHSALIIDDGKEGEGSCNDQRALDRPSLDVSRAGRSVRCSTDASKF